MTAEREVGAGCGKAPNRAKCSASDGFVVACWAMFIVKRGSKRGSWEARKETEREAKKEGQGQKGDRKGGRRDEKGGRKEDILIIDPCVAVLAGSEGMVKSDGAFVVQKWARRLDSRSWFC